MHRIANSFLYFWKLYLWIMNNLFRIPCKYIHHSFTARHTGGFGIHSPFVFNFTKYVIEEKNPFYAFSDIERIRKEYTKDNRNIQVTDYGTGTSGIKRVGDIAVRSLKEPKYGQLLFRIVNYCKCSHVLELGTSLGVTTAYMASPDAHIRCVTMEGCPEIAKLAGETFSSLHLDNITQVVGNIDEKLPEVLDGNEPFDLIFLDANHRSEAILSYFDQCVQHVHDHSVIVVDDINWSEDMEHAWNGIRNHEKVTASIDLFQMGIVFFNRELEKKTYKMRF